MRDLASAPRVHDLFWYCPAALATVPSTDGWTEVAPRKDRRKEQRALAQARKRAQEEQREEGQTSEGWASDGAESRASSVSKIARRTQASVSLRPHGNAGSSFSPGSRG